MAVYSYNRFAKLNPTNPINENVYLNEDKVFTESADVQSVVEIMSNAIINDENEVFKVCIESASTEVLQEGVADIAKKIRDAIGKIIDQIKKIPGIIAKFFRDLVSRFKFKTNSKGELTKETITAVEKQISDEAPKDTSSSTTTAAKPEAKPAPDTTYSKAATQNKPLALGTKKWRDIHELVGVKLREEIEVLKMFEDANRYSSNKQWDNPIDVIARQATLNIEETGEFIDKFYSPFARSFYDRDHGFKVTDDNGKVRGRMPNNTIDKAWFQEELAKKREVTSKGISTKRTIDGKEYDKIPAHPAKKKDDMISKEELDQILENSEVDVKSVEKKMEAIYREALDQLRYYQETKIPQSDFDYLSSDPAEKKKAEDICQLFNQYVLKVIMEASQSVYTLYNNSCSYIEDVVATSCSSRKKLEAELLWRYKNEVMSGS